MIQAICTLRIWQFKKHKVGASTGIISTVAGVHVGQGEPATKHCFTQRQLLLIQWQYYIADVTNNMIREVSSATGLISTVAGNGTFAYSGDGAKAIYAEMEFPEGLTFSRTQALTCISAIL